jgi:hypothetical protein
VLSLKVSQYVKKTDTQIIKIRVLSRRFLLKTKT